MPGSFPRSSPSLAGELVTAHTSALRVRRAELPSVAQVVALQTRLQPQDGLGVELRDARLGHPEHLADLPQRQVLVVVERDDELLALGQRRDRLGQAVLELR